MMKATFYSNFIENLTEKLKKNIFFDFSNLQSYIFVPNKFIKNWLMKKFCDDPNLKVSFDIKFVNFNNFLNSVQNGLKVSKEKRFLNFLELNLIIREKILFYISNDNSKYKVLYNYLIKNGEILEKRLSQLCDELTESFLKYSIFGNFEDLKEKLKNYWQAALFYDIFYIDNYSLAFRDLKKIDVSIFENCFFHFFSINYIPPLYFDFINKFSNVFHYINSPCKVFFEDIISDYERHKLKKYWIQKNKPVLKINELDSYLKKRNSFLANMEKLKRNYFTVISNYEDFYSFENYYEKENKNFLSLFQNDILNLENRNEKNYGIISKEESFFQIHVAPNKFREIQILHSNILSILSSNKDIDLSDVHVIAPNIDDYAAYIHMIFNDRQNPLNYKIGDLSLAKTSHLISGIDKLFSLANSRFEKEDILELFENPLFQKRHKITKEEIIILFDLIEKANISLGIDENHILKNLENNDQIKTLYQKSWDRGLSRILFGMIFILNNNYVDNSFSYDFFADSLDMSDCCVILDKFLKIFFNIIEDLKIIENKKLLLLKDWQLYFRKIINKYFLIDDSFIEKNAYDACLKFFNDLKNISFRFEKNTYLFETIYNHFKKYVNQRKTHFNINNEQAVYFSSFSISCILAKAIFIIGLDSEAIKFYSKSSLDLNNNKGPTENDLKRSLFLETILSAKDYLILSYPSANNYKIDSSVVLQELLFYLDNSYRILNQKPSNYFVKKHLSFSFHKDYFSDNKKSFSGIDFLAAQNYYNQENKIKKEEKYDKTKELPDVIDIDSFRLLCKNPIKFYLNKSLGIYLKEETKDNDFNFSFLDKYIIKQASLSEEIENILFSYEKKANVPLGIFYEIEKEKIKEEVKIFHENLKALEIDKTNLITIDFNLQTEKIKQVEKNYFQAPAIEIVTKNKVIKLIGKQKNITNKGLLVNLDDKPSDLIRLWPDLLIYYKLDSSFLKQIIFFKSLKLRSFDLKNVDEHLSNYIEYYLMSLNEPSFLIKPFIRPIIEADEKALNKAIKKVYEEKNLTLDVYTNWFLLNYKKPDSKQILDKWSKFFSFMFKPVLEVN